MSKWDSKLHLKTGIDLAFMARYAKLFVNRSYVHGEQKIYKDGNVRYRNNLPGAIDLFRIRQALYGERTYAAYGCDRQGKSKWVVFDLDIPRAMRKEIEETKDTDLQEKLQAHAWRRIHLMTESVMAEIRHLGLAPVPLSSGSKGLHIYILFDQALEAESAVKLGLLVKWLAHKTQESSELQGIIDYMVIESYPCLSDLRALMTDGVPHLVKLPLVKHLGSGLFSRFLDPDNPRIEQPLPNSHLWNLRPDANEIVLDSLESFKEELKEASDHSRLYAVEAGPTNHPQTETYFRKNIPDGPKKVVERCTAMRQLVYKAIRERHLTHDERLFILFNLIAFGGDGVAAVHDLMRQASDYDFSKTQYFIDHALRRNYYPYLCETAQEKGVCPLTEACHAVGMYRTPLGVITGYDADNRSLIQPVLGELKPDFETGTLEEIRQEIREKLQTYLRAAPEKALLIQVDPGVGKTVSTAKALADLPDDLKKSYRRIFWAGQRHDMFEEVVKHLPNIKQILPKIGEDEDFPHSTPEKSGLCQVDECRYQLRIMRNKGWAEIETEKVCLECPVGIKNCEYFRQWDHKGSFFAPQQHLVTNRIQDNKINCDVIVIDENPASVFDSEIIVTQDEIDELVELIQTKRFARSELMVKLLNCLRRTVASYRKLTQGYELIKDWDDRIRLLHGDNSRQGEIINDDAKKTPEKGLHHLLNEIDKSRFWIDWLAFIDLAEPEDLPKNWLGPLFKAVKQQKLLFDIEHNSRIYIKQQKEHMVLGLLESKTFKNMDNPIIFLDATADLSAYKRLLDREFIHFHRQLKMLNPVYQLIDGEYPMLSIMPDNERSQRTRMKLLRFTKAIIEKGEKTLVVSTMQFHNKYLANHLKNARLSKKYVTGYYRNLRGSNEYMDCDQIVLIGVANPNTEELHIKEQARRVEEDYLSNKTTKDHQQYPGSKIKRKSWFYEDQRMNAIIRQNREYEMVQAIYRIRPLLFPARKIWILSAIQLPLSTTPVGLNSDELSMQLGMKLQTRGKLNRAKPAYDKLRKAVIKLRRNDHIQFSTKKLADTAGVNLRTTQKYIQRLCEDIPYLKRKNDEFQIQENSENA